MKYQFSKYCSQSTVCPEAKQHKIRNLRKIEMFYQQATKYTLCRLSFDPGAFVPLFFHLFTNSWKYI